MLQHTHKLIVGKYIQFLYIFTLHIYATCITKNIYQVRLYSLPHLPVLQQDQYHVAS